MKISNLKGLPVALVLTLTFINTAHGYCFYNKSDDFPLITVWMFRSASKAQQALKAIGWTGTIAEVISTTAKFAGKVAKSPKAQLAAGIIGEVVPELGKIVKGLTGEIAPKKHYYISYGHKNCWNWDDIRKDYKDNNLTDLYWVVFEGTVRPEATSTLDKLNILYQGMNNLTCGLVFTGLGRVSESYPWINDPEKTKAAKGGDYEFQGKTYDIVWKHFKDGRKLGLKAAPWVYGGRK